MTSLRDARLDNVITEVNVSTEVASSVWGIILREIKWFNTVSNRKYLKVIWRTNRGGVRKYTEQHWETTQGNDRLHNVEDDRTGEIEGRYGAQGIDCPHGSHVQGVKDDETGWQGKQHLNVTQDIGRPHECNGRDKNIDQMQDGRNDEVGEAEATATTMPSCRSKRNVKPKRSSRGWVTNKFCICQQAWGWGVPFVQLYSVTCVQNGIILIVLSAWGTLAWI